LLDKSSFGGTFTVTAVPEPSTLAMVILGFLGLGWMVSAEQQGAQLHLMAASSGDKKAPRSSMTHHVCTGRPNMRLPASEKLEIIYLVEQSHRPARRTLYSGSNHRRFIGGMTGSDPAGPEASKTSRHSRVASHGTSRFRQITNENCLCSFLNRFPRLLEPV
jgi:hypothetical protein